MTGPVAGEDAIDLPAPCLVGVVGPGAPGKSTWAGEHLSVG